MSKARAIIRAVAMAESGLDERPAILNEPGNASDDARRVGS